MDTVYMSTTEAAACLPTVDRQVLSALATVSDIQAWVNSKADEYRKFALALLSIHNLVSPIHRLPIDVLDQVLLLSWHSRASLRLLHVCRLWRMVLSARTTFWANALADCEFHQERTVIRHEIPYLDTLLARSAPQPVRTRFYGFPPPIVEFLTPYVGRLASLQVAVDKLDLLNGLWPALRSGTLRSLAALTIEVMVTEKDVENDREGRQLWFQTGWGRNAPAVLSVDHLPSLTHLTCPPSLLECFSIPSIIHLKMQWWDHSRAYRLIPAVMDDSVLRRELTRYAEHLESLEFSAITFLPPWHDASGRIPLSHIRHLRIAVAGFGGYIPQLLGWLSVPPSAFVHIVEEDGGGSNVHGCLPFEHQGGPLRRIAATVDRLHVQQIVNGTRYLVRFYTAGAERLRMDGHGLCGLSLADVFRDHARVTHLAFSAYDTGNPYLEHNLFYAFPHLQDLEISGRAARCLLRELQPAGDTERIKRARSDLACPSLAELRVAFELVSGGEEGPADAGRHSVEDRLQEECSVLEQVLALRAAEGSRLTSLEVRVGFVGLPDDPGNSAHIAVADDSSWEVLGHGQPVKESVLEGLHEMVDGPVIFEVVDSGNVVLHRQRCNA